MSDRGGDVCPATFGNEKTGLKLDGRRAISHSSPFPERAFKKHHKCTHAIATAYRFNRFNPSLILCC